MVQVFSDFEPDEAAANDHSARGLFLINIAVSYTHLDVYKRQGVDKATDFKVGPEPKKKSM